MGILLTGGIVVTAADTYPADVRLEGEKITAIGRNIAQDGDQRVNVAGCYLFPGGIDPHTHFDLPIGDMRTADSFASGSKAALIGGTTTIIDYATQFKGESLGTGLTNWHALARDNCYTDYGFHMAITDWNDTIAREMKELVEEHGISSFKLYMAYKNVLQVDDGALLSAFHAAASCGAILCLHCENGDVIDTLIRQSIRQGRTEPRYHPVSRPALVEEEATRRAILLAKMADAPLYVVHLTCAGALTAVEEAKRAGLPVYAETCPQYLLLDESYYEQAGFESAKYVISPPLRNRANQPVLWQGLTNHMLDTVATDHCSFHFSGQKDLGLHDFSKIPNGMPGVETRLSLLYTYGVAGGRINLNQFVALTATNAAKVFGLYPRKGTIAVGSDADITVWDPCYEGIISAQTQAQRVDYSPFEGFVQKGRAKYVYLRGRLAAGEGQLIASQADGQYLQRSPFRTGIL
ncbi:dihydropyrimidinase [Anaerospora hongkongensis]|uniref:dihydropyrimidinase n=1 Tax=Anaerospora hongkongensis TaxID=244830 RepID=UPI002FD952A0